MNRYTLISIKKSDDGDLIFGDIFSRATCDESLDIIDSYQRNHNLVDDTNYRIKEFDVYVLVNLQSGKKYKTEYISKVIEKLKERKSVQDWYK